MAVFPLSEQYRSDLADKLIDEIGVGDPLPFLNRHVFQNYPGIGMSILPAWRGTPGDVVCRIDRR